MAGKENNTRIQVTIPKKLKIQLELKAKEDNHSVSNYIVNLIRDNIMYSSPLKKMKVFCT